MGQEERAGQVADGAELASAIYDHLPYGLVQFALGPFPWQVRGIRQIPALVDVAVLWALAHQWNDDPDMGHGFLVPVIAGWIVWRKRRELRAPRPDPWWACVARPVTYLGARSVRSLARPAFDLDHIRHFLRNRRCHLLDAREPCRKEIRTRRRVH